MMKPKVHPKPKGQHSKPAQAQARAQVANETPHTAQTVHTPFKGKQTLIERQHSSPIMQPKFGVGTGTKPNFFVK